MAAAAAATTFFPLLLLALLPSLPLSSSSPTDVTRQTYIVRVHSDLKPAIYPDHTLWYASTLQSVSPSPVLLHVYDTVFHGFSAVLAPEEARELEIKRGVLAVFPDRVRQLHTTRTPFILGLRSARHHPHGLLAESDYGSDTIIGIFDSGINPRRRSFRDAGLGPPPKRWRGVCEEGRGFQNSSCNNKLIGARFFPSGYEAQMGAISGNFSSGEFLSPYDSAGHGTHTASTAAGRHVHNASLFGYAAGVASGVAPKARIAVYKICWATGCFDSDIIAAFDKAVSDGVDVISISVGSFAVEYDVDPIAIGAFGAMEKGVFVSMSAGNDGPSTAIVANVAPWITTVGAGTIDRKFPAEVILGDGSVITGAALHGGLPLPPDQPIPLVYAGDVNKVPGMGPFCMYGSLDPAQVGGKIVMCDRGGSISRSQKAYAVKDAGGTGLIIANQSPDGDGLVPETHILPAINVGEKDGYRIRAYMSNSPNPTAKLRFRQTEVGVKPAPVLASFSSRGPNSVSPYVVKPDVIAPGVGILASWTDSAGPTNLPADLRRKIEFNILSGTSMSCPHVSGLAALLKGTHPDWSPAAIKSAIMTTSYAKDTLGNEIVDESTGQEAALWGVGSGHIDPERAKDPGLVYDITADDYIDFLCGSNLSSKSIQLITTKPVDCSKRTRKSPWDLNYPAISVILDRSEPGELEVSARRILTSVSGDVSTYRAEVIGFDGVAAVVVEPPTLVFERMGERKEFVVKVVKGQRLRKRSEAAGSSGTSFGVLTWSDGPHSVRSPLVVTWKQ